MKKSEIRDELTGRIRTLAVRVGSLNLRQAEYERRTNATIAELRSKEPDRNGRLDALTKRIAHLEKQLFVEADTHDEPSAQAAEPRSLDAEILDVLHRGRGVWMTPGSVYLSLRQHWPADPARPEVVDAHQVREQLGALASKGMVEPHLADDQLLAYRFPGGDR